MAALSRFLEVSEEELNALIQKLSQKETKKKKENMV